MRFLIAATCISPFVVSQRLMDIYSHRFEVNDDMPKMSQDELMDFAKSIMIEYNELVSSTRAEDLENKSPLKSILFAHLCKLSNSNGDCSKIDNPDLYLNGFLDVMKIARAGHALKPFERVPASEICSPNNPQAKNAATIHQQIFDDIREAYSSRKSSEKCIPDDGETVLKLEKIGESVLVNGASGETLPNGMVKRWNDHPRLTIQLIDSSYSYLYPSLNALSILGDVFPAKFTVANVSRICKFLIHVFEKRGEYSWPEIPKETLNVQYRRLARLVEIIRDIHSLGYIYGSLGDPNSVRFDSNDPQAVYLVDMLRVHKVLSDGGLFRDEFFRLANFIPDRELKFLFEFWKITNQNTLTCPPYDQWIELFISLSKGEKISENEQEMHRKFPAIFPSQNHHDGVNWNSARKFKFALSGLSPISVFDSRPPVQVEIFLQNGKTTKVSFAPGNGGVYISRKSVQPPNAVEYVELFSPNEVIFQQRYPQIFPETFLCKGKYSQDFLIRRPTFRLNYRLITTKIPAKKAAAFMVQFFILLRRVHSMGAVVITSNPNELCTFGFDRISDLKFCKADFEMFVDVENESIITNKENVPTRLENLKYFHTEFQKLIAAIPDGDFDKTEFESAFNQVGNMLDTAISVPDDAHGMPEYNRMIGLFYALSARFKEADLLPIPISDEFL